MVSNSSAVSQNVMKLADCCCSWRWVRVKIEVRLLGFARLCAGAIRDLANEVAHARGNKLSGRTRKIARGLVVLRHKKKRFATRASAT